MISSRKNNLFPKKFKKRKNNHRGDLSSMLWPLSGEVKKIVDNLSGVKQFVENARSKCKKCKTFSDAKPFSGKAISPWELAIGGLSADVSVSCMKGCFSYSYTINDYYDFDWHGNWLGLGSDRGGFFNELGVRGISILEPICGWKKFYHKGVYQETCQ